MLAAVLLVFTPLGDRPFAALFSVEEIPPTDFQRLELTPNPNQYLVCPANFCKATPHARSPEFEISIDRLRDRWQKMIDLQSNIMPLPTNGANNQLEYVQRTELMRYPDIITVQFIKISDTKSSLVLYSRSIYGRKDFGANNERIAQWLTLME